MAENIEGANITPLQQPSDATLVGGEPLRGRPGAADASRGALASDTKHSARGVASERPLHSDRGTTTIADSVVSKVAGIAAREVEGVHRLGGGGAARAFGNMTERVGLGGVINQGVAVEVGERQAAVDLTLVVEYGESIPRIAEQVRNQVIRRVEGITGLEVTEVNIAVDDLHLPGEDDETGSAP
ncbi:MAG: Asp23/Gls24 family envelope stress response protein [Solirubrobacteraceae bacterium]